MIRHWLTFFQNLISVWINYIGLLQYSRVTDSQIIYNSDNNSKIALTPVEPKSNDFKILTSSVISKLYREYSVLTLAHDQSIKQNVSGNNLSHINSIYNPIRTVVEAIWMAANSDARDDHTWLYRSNTWPMLITRRVDNIFWNNLEKY